MTPNELIALVGLAWSRLLLYPGGLAAFAALWLVAFLRNPTPGKLRLSEKPPNHQDTKAPRIKKRACESMSWLSVLGSLVPPWLALALLPLPPAPGLSRQTDIVIVLALLEYPRLLAIAGELRADATRRAGIRRLAAALNGYPALILATLALAQAAGSFDVAALARIPGDTAPTFARPLHWIGVGGWLLALPPLLGVGAFGSAESPLPASPAADDQTRPNRPESLAARLRDRARAALLATLGNPRRSGLGLRALGLVILAGLPWMAAFGALEEGGLRAPGGFAAWLLTPPLVAALAWGYDRLTRERPARRWARACLVIDGALLLGLLWAAYQALQNRLS